MLAIAAAVLFLIAAVLAFVGELGRWAWIILFVGLALLAAHHVWHVGPYGRSPR